MVVGESSKQVGVDGVGSECEMPTGRHAGVVCRVLEAGLGRL